MKRFFVWIVCVFALPVFSAAPVRLLVMPNDTEQPIVKLIRSAKKEIHLVTYIFTHNHLAKELIAAKHRGVRVVVMIERSPYRSGDVNVEMEKRLQAAGVEVKWANPQFRFTHQKTMTVDGKQALVMTFNYTYSSFNGQRDFALITSDRQAVAEIDRVFAADWAREPIKLRQSPRVWSNDNARLRLLGFIRRARHHLWVYNQSLSDWGIINALAHDADRGVVVEVIMPEKMIRRAHKKLQRLVRHGVQIRALTKRYVHAKAMVRDGGKEKQSFVGSMNFTSVALDHNREMGLFVASPAVSKRLLATFQHDWQHSVALLPQAK